jgi:small-conductance mechanosensitive channel
MQKFLLRYALVLGLALNASLAHADGTDAPASATLAAPPTSGVLTPEQARQALATLQDPQKRSDLENTLRALTLSPAGTAAVPVSPNAASAANAAPITVPATDHGATTGSSGTDTVHGAPLAARSTAPAAAPSAAPSVAPTTASSVAGTSPGTALLAALSKSTSPTASAPNAASSPLVSNGLIAQLVRQTSHWGRGVLLEARSAGGVLRGFPSVATWLHRTLHDTEARAECLQALWALACVMAAALAGEWLLARMLRHPRHLLAAGGLREERAAEAERQVTAVEIEAEAVAQAQREHAEVQAEREATLAAAGMAEPQDTNANADAARPASANASKPAPGQASNQAASAGPDGTAGRTAVPISAIMSASAHWRLLKRLPAILAHFVLTVLPLVAFFMIASAVSPLLTDDGSAGQSVIEAITNAYLVVRTILVIVRLIIAPDAPGLRMLLLTDHTAGRLQGWTMWIAGSIVLGSGLADALSDLGLNDAGHDAILRVAVLVGHGLAVAVVLRYRRAVNRTIRRHTQDKPSLAILGAWLADLWAFVAIFLIVASWFAWALNVKNGLSRVFDLLGQSIGIIALARIVAIVLLGALARLFNRGETPAEQSPVARRAHRYYPLLRKLVSALVWLVTVVILLQAWGIDSVHWLAFAPIGKSLISAGVTVGIAALVALLIWECVNAFVERRLETWNEGEDKLRAARLRTLLPMLRTILLIVIALIVGMTALTELGVNTAPLLASASIIGVALGFGSQKLVQDFITGIFLLMENAMQVGDYVTVAGVSGTVEYLSIRTVRLRGGDGSLYTVPFSSVSTVNNTNRGIGNAAVKVSVACDANLDLVIATLREIGASLRADPAYADLILNDFEYWGVDVVEGAMITVSGQVRSRDSGRWSVQREFNRRILLRFRELGITLADTQRHHLSLDAQALQVLSSARNITDAQGAQGAQREEPPPLSAREAPQQPKKNGD